MKSLERPPSDLADNLFIMTLTKCHLCVMGPVLTRIETKDLQNVIITVN